MRFLPLCLLVFVLGGSVKAQGWYDPFKGERELTPTKDFKNEAFRKESFICDGEQCGEYFLFVRSSHGNIITFQIPKREGDASETKYVRCIVNDWLRIKLDDDKKVPTAEFIVNQNSSPYFLLRMSREYYEAKSCFKFIEKVE